jgi:H/ACA ribonucleoprotein complex subunit 4
MDPRFPWMKTREIKVKKPSETDPKYGTDPFKRDIKNHLDFGIVNIDKPAGPSSHQVAAYVKRIIHLVDKTGHSGTLDPMVTGVLPTALGRGTRIVQSLLTAGKEYVCLMTVHADVDEARLREAIMKFVGEIDQMPPVRSAVKRQLRKRTIYYIDIIDIKERQVLFKVGCQAGTYIRKLCDDIGTKLGCGAHMEELRRTQAGPFDETTLCTLQDLTDAIHYMQEDKNDYYLRKKVMPVELGTGHMAKVWVHDNTVNSLCHGAYLNVPGVSKLHTNIRPGEKVAVMTLKGELILVGIAQMATEEVMNKDKGLFVKPEQVFMLPETYPKMKSA